MKKLHVVFLFGLLTACSSSPEVSPTVTADIVQTPSLLPTEAAMPPTQTLAPTSTFTPTATQTSTAIGGGAGKIAFTSERDGFQEIYVIQPDGSQLSKLTNSLTPKSDPAWSPDGKKIAFASNKDNSASLYIMDASGSHPTKLIDAKDLSMNRQATLDWQLGIDCPV